jgi:adenosylhomocysteine nucleosidase
MLYSSRQPSYALVLMLLIAAAMEEELQLAMVHCRDREKIENQGIFYWQARRAEKTITFSKTGIGPRRSASNLERILNLLTPSRILLIGYAGALDPNLKLGDLVAIKRALDCSLSGGDPALSNLQLDRQFELTDPDAIVESARSLGLRAFTGNALTSAYVLGIPEDKRFLYQKYGASIVDMETAAVARVAAFRNIPFSCVRAISDEAEDTFLAPFSYNPSANIAARAAKIIGTGIQSYQQWKTNAKAAGETLNRFLAQYL